MVHRRIDPAGRAVYYRAVDGSEPVDVFRTRTSPRVQVAIDNQIERIRLFGPRLPFPHSSQGVR
jgi:hypothetical protein